MLKIGLLGASRIAPSAILEASLSLPGVTVVAVAARDFDRARAYAAQHGIPNVEPSYEALLARSDLDLIYNALPVPLHELWTVAALTAGKHVLLEKPSALTASQARTMVDAAIRNGRRLIEGFHYRYHPLFTRVLEIVRSGELGEIFRADAVIDVPVPFRPGEIRWDPDMGGGALMDLGCYPVHWLRTLCGPFEVRSAKIELAPTGVDQRVDATLRFMDGVEGNLTCSMTPHDRGRTTTLHVVGDRGELFVRNPITPQTGHEMRWRTHGDWRHETAVSTTSYFHQLAAVEAALKNGTNLPTEGDDIVDNLAAIEAIYRSGGYRL
jgi:predicted dehydrogenase